ncbi:MAG: helix-turn-helix transcriptional regulator, partial [Salinivirgaceae bacterium]|nr:helix-turn-helix transcriptional regulator [Salinivirgaceae bacterium]
MKTITQKEIGQRISELRKSKGYSQDDLAKMLDISRSSLTQIELGKRNLSVIELRKITNILSVSIDNILASNYSLTELVNEKEEIVEESKFRVSVPELKINKFKNILLYILENCAGK